LQGYFHGDTTPKNFTINIWSQEKEEDRRSRKLRKKLRNIYEKMAE